ncbi:MAG: hypothetical protein ACR2NB_13810 [Solirubrobacteraceae bacterium]
MSVLSRLVLSLLLLGALLIPAAAEAAVTPTGEEDVVRWNRPFRPDGSKLPKVTRKARHLRIQFATGVCGLDGQDPVSRIGVERSRRLVVITVLLRRLEPPPDTVCPAVARVFRRRVSLEGRLGARSITDGATDPPEVRVKRPRR